MLGLKKLNSSISIGTKSVPSEDCSVQEQAKITGTKSQCGNKEKKSLQSLHD